jgi:hypothetical protein
VSPVKALEDLRRLPMTDGERQRIAMHWAALVQRLNRDGVPDMVREGVKFEQARFATLVERRKAAPPVPLQHGRDR